MATITQPAELDPMTLGDTIGVALRANLWYQKQSHAIERDKSKRDANTQKSNQHEEKTIAEQTLYERLGGAYAIAGAVDYLIDRLHTNATLNNANDKVKEFHSPQYKAGYKFMVTAWSIEVSGGPACYPGLDMFEAHKNLGLTEYEFDVTAHEIRNTLYNCGVPRQEVNDFMDIIESYRGKVVAAAA